MPNAPYRQLRKCLEKAITLPPVSTDVERICHAVLDHMDILVSDTSSVSAIGHLFVSRFSQECPPLNQTCSPGLQVLGREAFKWSIAQEDWTSAAWLISFSGLAIPLPSPFHPHPKVLHALICNDSMDWPVVYTASLKDNTLVNEAFSCDRHDLAEDETALDALTRKYFSQIRKACYMGPGQGLFAVNIAMRWLALHHDDSPSSDQLPSKMTLRHAHPESEELSRLLQNQWRFMQFWSTGQAGYLDELSGIHSTDFQSWFWLLSAQGYDRFADMTEKRAVWDAWWNDRFSNVVQHANFWLNLHLQVLGENPVQLNKNERLLAVRAALALECRQPDGNYELPAENPEIRLAAAWHPAAAWH